MAGQTGMSDLLGSGNFVPAFMSSPTQTLRLGTRGSLLARTQSQLIATELEKHHPGLQVELVMIKTSGDLITDKPLHDLGGKGLFTKELELALLAGEVDFAVHSYKDVPVTMPLVDGAELIIAATPEREDVRDVLAFGQFPQGMEPLGLRDLPKGFRIGTGSLRRRCQILLHRPDLIVEPIRGNIDTRLRKLQEAQYDAIILAMAGLRRTGLFDASRMIVLEEKEMLPSPGQGALALQCRLQDDRTRELLAAIHQPDVDLCVKIERAIVARLNGDCHSPIAALATINGGQIHLQAVVGTREGGLPVVRAQATGPQDQGDTVTIDCLKKLEEQGVQQMLHSDR